MTILEYIKIRSEALVKESDSIHEMGVEYLKAHKIDEAEQMSERQSKILGAITELKFLKIKILRCHIS